MKTLVTLVQSPSWAGEDCIAALAEGALCHAKTGAVLVPISSHLAGAAGAKQGVTGPLGIGRIGSTLSREEMVKR